MAVLTDLPAELIRTIIRTLLSLPNHEARPAVYAFAHAVAYFKTTTRSVLEEKEHHWFDNPSRTYISYRISLEQFAKITCIEIDRLRFLGIHTADCVATIDRLRLRIHRHIDEQIMAKDTDKIIQRYERQLHVLQVNMVNYEEKDLLTDFRLQIKDCLDRCVFWEVRRIPPISELYRLRWREMVRKAKSTTFKDQERRTNSRIRLAS